ncbi:hypothetical protein GCM10010405_24940 [Streptomyces macrosporus]|uniref:Uncharacterized protein n=1 Tax=Streptomyces macrosporus TaxID=44032 RepID=A0ABP5WZ60_9ACTN
MATASRAAASSALRGDEDTAVLLWGEERKDLTAVNEGNFIRVTLPVGRWGIGVLFLSRDRAARRPAGRRTGSRARRRARPCPTVGTGARAGARFA